MPGPAHTRDSGQGTQAYPVLREWVLVRVVSSATARANEAGAKSFEQTVAFGRGEGFAIAGTLVYKVEPGGKVVVLNKASQQRAEGILSRLAPTQKTGGGIQRYKVHIEGLQEVGYRPEALNRCGVNVIP